MKNAFSFSLYLNGSKLLCLLFFVCLPAQLLAQTKNDSLSERNEFDDFRKELQDEYDDFRKEINDEYIDFLSKAWQEFRLFQGKTPDEIPKPLMPVPCQEEKNSIETVVDTDGVVDRKGNEIPVAKGENTHAISEETLWKTTDSLQLDYFGAKLRLRYQSKKFLLPAITEKSVGRLWKEMAGSRFSTLLNDMLRCKEKLQMNDWGYFQLSKKVAARISTLQTEDSRTVFQHFLLVQSGYDVRLARVDKFLVLLVPIREEVYACSYLEMNGRPYYVISDKDVKSYTNIYSYELPEGLIRKPTLSLMMEKELLLPMQPKPYTVAAAGLEVKGEVNVNKIRFYREYPLCELAVYARAVPDERQAKQLSASLSGQLARSPFPQALNRLLLWVQNGFRYQTDGEQFGREKPFFVEENFYYPACDCEDRSVLFAYLVRQIFDKDVVLLDYPGHVATAVCVDKVGNEEEIKGAYIRLEGKKYIVCDPTYMNATAGRVMPAYQSKRPKVIRL